MPMNERKRHKQRMHILRLLYQKGASSASLLSKTINMSLPTTRTLLEELIQQSAIRPSGTGESLGGRKPVIYAISENSFYVLAVELGHYKAHAVIVNSLNQWMTRVAEFEATIDDDDLVDKIDSVFRDLLLEAGLSEKRVEAIGISMPGLIDSVKGINKTIRKPELRSISERIKGRLGMPVYIENDARMQALGEFEFGIARNTRNALVINWSWGLGLGMIFNGEIYNGSTGNAGEISHIRVIEDGKLCQCGKRGCFQTVAGAKSLVDAARAEIGKGTISRLSTLFGEHPESIGPSDIIECARQGDELSITLLREIGTRLAWGLSILIQLNNPELIVLNGPLTKAGQYVLIPIRQALNQYCLHTILDNVRVEISDAEDYMGLKGVAVMAFNKLFAD